MLRRFETHLPLKVQPLRLRIRLLALPIAFTAGVGVASYILSCLAKRHRDHRYLRYGLVGSMVCANTVVYFLWTNGSRDVAKFLRKYMLSDVFSESRTLAMIGSMFSHFDERHLLLNMYALITLASTSLDPCKLAHIYLTGGLMGTIGSYLRAVYNPQTASVSLGASGAVLSVMGYSFAKDSGYSLPIISQLLPFRSSSDAALVGIILFEICGILLDGRKTIHTAHLFGLCFGWLMGQLE